MTDTGYDKDLVAGGRRRTGWRAGLMKAAPVAIALLALVFLSFVVGSLMTFKEVFPTNHLIDAFRAGRAVIEQATQYNEPFPHDFWQPARSEARGVTIYDPKRAFDGFTLYTSGHAQKAMLISMNGEVVHEWSLPYSKVWDESAAVAAPEPDDMMYLRKAQLLPNGDLIALYVASGTSPWGMGLVRMTADSEPVWKYLQQTHHDFDIGEDGRIYALTHEIRYDVVPGHQHLKPPRMDDYAVVLSPEGEELQKIWLLGALAQSPYAFVLSTVPWYVSKGKGDFLHTNAIDVVTAAEAAKAPFAEPGQILLSLREVSTIALLDPATEQVTWALRGPWLRQHDADLLPSGHMLLFDNEGGADGESRLLEFDPGTQEITWSYAGDARHPFHSRVRSAQERLPNGNTLVTESDGGRLFELTPDGEIVWEYFNPERGGAEGELIPIVSWGQRIDPATLDPGFRDALTH